MSTNGSAPISSAPIQVVRAAQLHHLVLTAMADFKAGLLLAASLLTLAITLLKAVQSPREYALLVLAATALLVALCCIKALTPRLLILTQNDSEPEINLLFCGHFAELAENEYVQKLRDRLGSEEAAFDAVARDLYQMGLVLHQKKLRAIALAFTVALLGLLATGITAVAMMVMKQGV